MHRISLVLAIITFTACNSTPGAAGEVGPAGPKGADGSIGAKGADGVNGTNGTNGQSAVITAEPASANCINGGVKIQVGTGTPSYVCDGAPQKYFVFIRGHLASPTMSVNKAAHDQLVSAVRATVTAAGDERHIPLLGAQDPRDFLDIDVWNNLAGLQGFLNNPQAQAGFGMLFDAPPTVTVMMAPAGYAGWGTLGPRPGTFVVSVRGTFGGAAVGNQASHNQVALGAQAAANSLGDYEHTAYLQRDALNNFQAIDHWDSLSGINTFLGNPDVQAAFGGLFSAPPTIDVYTTSDFAQY